MKTTIWIIVFIGFHTVLYAQRNPFNEILVYFDNGLTQETTIVNGAEIKSAKITSSSLKGALMDLGVDESMIKVAMPSFDKKDTLKTLPDRSLLSQSDMTRLYRIELKKDMSKDNMINKLKALPQVVYCEPNAIAQYCATIPNDDEFTDQWNLRNVASPGMDIHATQAWDIYKGDQDNIIAIIDGGVDINHIDLDDKITGGDLGYGWGGHGVHVAGIAAAETHNSEGIAGVDWYARIHSQRVDSTDLAGVYQAIVDAVNYSSNVHVLNNSWGIIQGEDFFGRDIPASYSITVALAVAYAHKANRTFVAAMGNHEHYLPGVVSYPAGYDNVIAVGSSNILDAIAFDSPSGSHIDVSAPGVNIMSTVPGNEYQSGSGTSMATPHVSGLASLLKGYNPNLSNDDISRLIQISCDDLNDPGDSLSGPGFDLRSGYGRINAETALNLLRAPNALKQWTSSGGTNYSTSDTYSMAIYGVSGITSRTYLVKRHEVRKVVTFPEPFYAAEESWGRGVSTSGWGMKSPNYGEGFCELVPGTLTTSGATYRTYVYELWNILGQYLGYYPTTPSNVTFAYTVLGKSYPTITGPDPVCYSSSTFVLNDLPLGATTVWSKSSNLNWVGSPTGTSCTVIASSSSVTSAGWVKTTITNTDNSILYVTKNIWIGKPTAPTTNPTGTYPYSEIEVGTYKYVFLQSTPGANFSGNWSAGNHLSTTGPTTGYSHSFLGTSEGMGAFYVTTSNACGTSIARQGGILVVDDGGGDPPPPVPFLKDEVLDTITIMKLSPNPANNYLNVTFNNIPGAVSEDYRIFVYDMNAKILKTDKMNGLSKALFVGDLREGLYIITVIANGKIYQEKLVVVK